MFPKLKTQDIIKQGKDTKLYKVVVSLLNTIKNDDSSIDLERNIRDIHFYLSWEFLST